MTRLLSAYFPLLDFAYILQLEEYNVRRYLTQVKLRLFKRGFMIRETLVFTARMKLTLLLTLLLLTGLTTILFLSSITAGVGFVIFLPVVLPYLLAIASVLVEVPADLYKKHTLNRARTYFTRTYPDAMVIGITGSFGKTTAKYLLRHILQYDFQVAIIPDNINTGIGIANYILANKLPKRIDVLLVEMAAYTRGDISETASMLPPDKAILTILGDQHLERFGSIENLIQGKCEIFTTNPKTICYVSSDSVPRIQEQSIPVTNLVPVTIPVGQKSTRWLVSKLAADLEVSDQSIASSLESFVPPDRRNNIFERQGVTIIDNSYNISPMVAEAMIKEGAEVAKQMNKKLVVMTGGIGEQGADGPKANQELGTLLNSYATRVIIHPSVYSSDVKKTLQIPSVLAAKGLDVSEQPAEWINSKTEVLLWLTDHSDLAYL